MGPGVEALDGSEDSGDINGGRMGGQKEVEEGGLKNEAGNALVSFGEVQCCTCTLCRSSSSCHSRHSEDA